MFLIEVTYAGLTLPALDDFLERRSEENGGRWFGSGTLLTGEKRRDIEFHFAAEAGGKAFADRCRTLPGVTVVGPNRDANSDEITTIPKIISEH
jgi:hypothetical protein